MQCFNWKKINLFTEETQNMQHKKLMYPGYRILSNFSPYIEFYNNEVSFRNTKK